MKTGTMVVCQNCGHWTETTYGACFECGSSKGLAKPSCLICKYRGVENCEKHGKGSN